MTPSEQSVNGPPGVWTAWTVERRLISIAGDRRMGEVVLAIGGEDHLRLNPGHVEQLVNGLVAAIDEACPGIGRDIAKSVLERRS